MRRLTWIAASTVVCLMIVPSVSAEDAKLTGEFYITANDPGLKCGGGEESMTEQGELPPYDLQIDPETGLGEFGIDVGSVGARNGNGFGGVSARISGKLSLWDGMVTESQAGGHRNAGYWGRANEQGDLKGQAQLDVERMTPLESQAPDAHSVWRVSGTYSGNLLHSGANDGWSDHHEGTGDALGSASGGFTVYVYAYLDDRRNEEHFLPIQRGTLYSIHRDRILEPGDRVTEGELLENVGDEPVMIAYPNGSLHMSPGARACLIGVTKPHTPQERDFDWCASFVRVIKGMVGAIVTPIKEGGPDPELLKFRSVVCCGGVHGTTLQIEVNEDWERVTCVEGELWVEHNETGERVQLPAGRQVVATAEGLNLQALSAEDSERFVKAYEGIEAAVASVLAAEQAQAKPGKLIHGVNQYSGEIIAHMTWRQPDGSWHKVDWVVPGGAEGYLAIDGERVVADTVMHWAESRDGKLTWRSGLRQQPVDITEAEGEAWRVTWGAPN